MANCKWYIFKLQEQMCSSKIELEILIAFCHDHQWRRIAFSDQFWCGNSLDFSNCVHFVNGQWRRIALGEP